VWYPLETVLEFWLGQIRKRRIAALTEASDDRTEPWEFVPYNDVMLEENLRAWDRLVEAIEARMPPTPEAEEYVRGLIDETVLQTIRLPKGFAYDFLRRTRKPRFRNNSARPRSPHHFNIPRPTLPLLHSLWYSPDTCSATLTLKVQLHRQNKATLSHWRPNTPTLLILHTNYNVPRGPVPPPYFHNERRRRSPLPPALWYRVQRLCAQERW
jgi:hypothetical protein